MYAIVKSGGKQYRVEAGQRLLVERLAADVGATVSLEPLLYRSDDVAFDEASLARVKVSAKVLAHERGPKLRVFKFKPKRGYKRRTGHRQELTRIEVGEITAGARSRAASAHGEEGARKPAAARRPAAARKPAAVGDEAPARASAAKKADAEEPAAKAPARGRRSAGEPRSSGSGKAPAKAGSDAKSANEESDHGS
jgi:large subunit ribosomal protein L21